MREVALGNTNGDTYTIISGLENGDQIVTNGTFSVDAAAQLQGKKIDDERRRRKNHDRA